VNRDLAFGYATLALSAGYYAAASAIPASFLADSVGPQRLPQTYAVVLAVLSLVLIIRSVSHRRDAPSRSSPHERAATDWKALQRAAGMLLIGAIYLAAVPWLGYALSLAALIAATTFYQGGVFNRRVALVAATGAACFWLLFVRLLQIPHPAGFWPSLF
jgi:Na+/H+ antiporter NhaD/arsenite permease-like protein